MTWIRLSAKMPGVTCLRAVALLSAVAAVGPAAAQSADRARIDHAIAAVYPSLVRISVVAVDYRDGREINVEAFGSGTIISQDGFIVTNHHVAGRARRIVCMLPDKEEVPADLVGSDPLSDIAVLKLRPRTPRTFPAARFGVSSALRRGDPVLAMGSPLALSQSVTLGVVSNTEMTMPPGRSGLALDGEDVGLIVRWIGHDAAIFPGNSGGPLVDLAGEIVGVNEISLGLGGAIPSDLAKRVADLLIRDGRVRRSWTGFDLQPMVGVEKGSGALISWVASGSPAADAGLRAGDVLVRVNETPVDVQFAEQLPLVNQLLFGLAIGEPSRFVVRRESGEAPMTLRPIERPPTTSIPGEVRGWGLLASNLTPFESRELGRVTTAGVRVVSVRPGGPSEQAKPPLARDDVILDVEGQPVRSLAELETRTREVLGERARWGMLVGLERGRARRLSVIEVVGESPAETPPAEARKAWVAIDVQVLTPPLAERLGLAGRTGVRVTQVIDPDLPLKIGDIILAIGGQGVRASAPNDEEVFAAAIRRYAIGATIDLTVNRDGSQITVPVELGTAQALAREMKRYEDADFGFRVRNLTDGDRRDPRLEDVKTGVFVDSVNQGSWASLARLAGGDVIGTVDGRPVANVDELAERLKEIKALRPASVVLFVHRGVKTLFLDLQPAWR